jgi:ribonuclease III
MKNLKEIEKRIGIRFRHKELLRQAITHYSCFGRYKNGQNSHYERLEFLGDSVLGSYISQIIFQTHPDYSEEELTNLKSELTSNNFLAEVAEKIGLSGFIRFSDEPFDYCFTERSRLQIYADCVEAIIGAICIDRGERRARKFIDRHILSRLGDATERAGQDDPKSALQKLIHQKYNENPVYERLGETGTGEDYRCQVGVYVRGKLLAAGTGVNKKEAGANAAEAALLQQLGGNGVL